MTASGIVRTPQLAAVLAGAAPLFRLGLDYLLSGRIIPGSDFVVIAPVTLASGG